ncbi:Isoleucine--tRNA ligase [Candidatus Arsenophonus lipoptenae]|uniref:Isoleucine--tRNA ligase n=1 Tax=Candidatus Arsenophonus lipoptenae TaxID=634113 RepID=A0A0X9VRW7_9GAMM|nr:isoleucine--tRNA ligase [Candidatus Arsenophonus lipoptenae]AMA64847.1 Isoleucine--tRNA ligase [Candidatus Arsenophonus lipoptenae]
MNNYKNTLNLPKTAFPMRGNLSKREPEILDRWYKDCLYQSIRQAKKDKEMFILHDGPPYANGEIHIGHAVNKILKDIIIKSKGLAGFDAPYIPGWDCHGLPIEHKVEQIIGRPGDKLSDSKFRDICRQYAKKQIERQKLDFIRMGVLGDWEHPYLTMDFNTEANTIRYFGKIIEKGYLVKGVKPVHWCTSCGSSLSDAEVEYSNRSTPAIYVCFRAVDSQYVYDKFGLKAINLPISAVIWTTTPWTLPANRGIAVNANFTYQLVKINNYECLILEKSFVEIVIQLIAVTEWQVIAECNGYELELLQFHHPFMDFNVPIILSDHVTLDIGTGLVHTAPAHGQEDYIIGQKYNLEIANPVDLYGCYLPNTYPGLDGIFIFKADDFIIEILNVKNKLLYKEIFQHSYPYCWRHKIPVIFRSTPQWFISVEKHNLREQILKEIKNVKWIPNYSENRIRSMVTNRPDWCISRQRNWGVPMVLFINKKTQELHPKTLELIEKIAKQVEKSGTQAWWDLDPVTILGSDSLNYVKVFDTLDVWFDSGSTDFTVVNIRPEFKGNPIDLYLEGADQHRGWFMSSLILSTIVKNKAPYKEVLTHGFTVDGQGRKMSKSLGNTISPQDVMNNFGADILRLWIASTDYTNEIAISNEILKHSVDNYRRIRNTARFLLANLNDFNPNLHQIIPKQMVSLDLWAINRAKSVQEEIIMHYANYDFHAVINCLMKFCSVEMSSCYLDIIKDRQYTLKYDSLARRSCQTAIFHIIESLVRWIAPILSFTADEIWQQLPGKHNKYVFTEEYYVGLFNSNKIVHDKLWDTLFIVRNEVNKVLEKARRKKIINSSLDASVTLYVNTELYKKLNELGDELHFILLTSDAKVMNITKAPVQAHNGELNGLKITFKKAEGNKCPRCWHYSVDIGSDVNYPELCARCICNINGNGEIRKFA